MGDWISVDDRLPEENGNYKFCIDGVPAEENGHWQDTDYFDPNVDWMYNWYTSAGTRVTHWKPKK